MKDRLPPLTPGQGLANTMSSGQTSSNWGPLSQARMSREMRQAGSRTRAAKMPVVCDSCWTRVTDIAGSGVM